MLTLWINQVNRFPILFQISVKHYINTSKTSLYPFAIDGGNFLSRRHAWFVSSSDLMIISWTVLCVAELNWNKTYSFAEG